MSTKVSHLADTAHRTPVPAGAEPDAGIPPPGSLREALSALAAELSARGWSSRVRALPRRPLGLRVSNPEREAAALSEDIYALVRDDGRWEYWWPWGERIAASPADAAAVIVRVLRPAGRQ
jgi:hypothetical protein